MNELCSGEGRAPRTGHGKGTELPSWEKEDGSGTQAPAADGRAARRMPVPPTSFSQWAREAGTPASLLQSGAGAAQGRVTLQPEPLYCQPTGL